MLLRFAGGGKKYNNKAICVKLILNTKDDQGAHCLSDGSKYESRCSGGFKHSLIIRITVAAHYFHTSNYLLSKGHPSLSILKKLGKIEGKKKKTPQVEKSKYTPQILQVQS